MRQEVTGRLEDWVFDSYHRVIWGFCYGDVRGRFRDGTWIHTSMIPDFVKTPDEFKRKTRKGSRVKTLNSLYLLGSKRRQRK